ncbi:hypothetical protein UA08_08024 [Talaromyces atroroseus]|uniref:rRNA adenine N(6)-methyltransferase n=1 Tax=Talaromyces atroroseus TaxID=1441469 RepID=A0A225AFN3_TALAT|nr:hypothetical protein UA08_08024 [Talaromyces atroroseus]OKL56884.1 hypothetical protein UA08_08024 [Talaromyces atroroseus]
MNPRPLNPRGLTLRPRLEVFGRANVLSVRCLASASAPIVPKKKRKAVGTKEPRGPSRIDIVSEAFCDDLANHISRLFETNKPSVILDLCPGRSILSSKINDLIKPERHVVIEHRMSRYQRNIKKRLADKKGVEVHDEKLHYDTVKGISWMNVLNTYMADSTPQPGRNDLLILANLTDKAFKNPSRVWASLVGHSLIDRGHFRDWTIRTLMILPPDEAHLVVPRSAKDRRKVAMLTEAYAHRALYVAETDNSEYVASRECELASESAKLVAQRAEENNITIPEGRRQPAIQSMSDVPGGPRAPGFTTHTPIYAGYQAQHFWQAQQEFEQAVDLKPGTNEYQKARSHVWNVRAQLMHHARCVDVSIEFAKAQLQVDSLEKEMVKAKLESSKPSTAAKATDLATLDEMNTKLIQARAEMARKLDETPILANRTMPNYIDDYRMALGATGHIKDSHLLWDHRLFEPLYIRPDEVERTESRCSIMYVEPEHKDKLAERFAVDRAHDRPDEAVEIALSVIGSFGIRGRDPVSEMLDKLFPGQPINEVVKSVPELFAYIPKHLLSPPLEDKNEANGDSIYDDFEYFPQQVHLRSLPLSVLLKLLKAYLATTSSKSFLQVNRSLGGSATMYALRSWVFDIQDKK